MTNRLQKIEKAINNLSNDKFNELLNDLGIKEEEQWVPGYREDYYSSISGGIRKTFWTDDTYDNYRLLMNNVFKTEEEAKAQRDFNIEKAKLIKEIKDSSDEIDWEDGEQYKHYMYYVYDDGTIDISENLVCGSQGATYTTNRVFLENLIATEPERVKKYLFGIGE